MNVKVEEIREAVDGTPGAIRPTGNFVVVTPHERDDEKLYYMTAVIWFGAAEFIGEVPFGDDPEGAQFRALEMGREWFRRN